jgi:hypothetical protein
MILMNMAYFLLCETYLNLINIYKKNEKHHTSQGLKDSWGGMNSRVEGLTTPSSYGTIEEIGLFEKGEYLNELFIIRKHIPLSLFWKLHALINACFFI